MEFEKLVRPLVEAFVQEFEEALRAQLEARLLGGAAPARAAARGRSPAAPHAFAVPDAPPAASQLSLDAAPAPPVPVVAKPEPVASAPSSGGPRADPTIERILAFVADNQDRMDEEGEPLRIQPALIASHLGLAPPLVKAVVDHLVTTRKLERRGAGRAAYYMRSAA